MAQGWLGSQLASPVCGVQQQPLTCDRPRLTRVMVSRITGPPAPCALSLPTSSWSNTATARTALSPARASGAEVESMSACVVVGGVWRNRQRTGEARSRCNMHPSDMPTGHGMGACQRYLHACYTPDGSLPN
jgi:hypothetical protein